MKTKKKAATYREGQLAINAALKAIEDIYIEPNGCNEEKALIGRVISDLQSAQSNSIKARLRWTTQLDS